jgi:hypothetical protein
VIQRRGGHDFFSSSLFTLPLLCLPHFSSTLSLLYSITLPLLCSPLFTLFLLCSALTSSPFLNAANNNSKILSKSVVFHYCLNLYLHLYLCVTVQDSKGWVAFLQQWVAPERFGFEKLDSINYYTSKLIELNKKVGQCYKYTFTLTLSSSIFLSCLIPSFFHSLIYLAYSLSSILAC